MKLRTRAPSEPGAWRLPNGDAYYRAALALETTTTLTPAEVHQQALARVKAASAQLDMMLRSQGLAEGAPGARVGLMAVDPRFGYTQEDWRSEAIREVSAQEKRAAAIASRWFRTPPSGRMDVRGTSALDAAPGYAPAAYDGRRAAALALDLAIPGVTPRFDLGSIAFGDGLPGRHLQSGTAMASADVPLLRRMLDFSAYADGWAEYAEQLADEMGLYEGGPTQRLGFLRASARHAALAVVDTGVHYLRWTMDRRARTWLRTLASRGERRRRSPTLPRAQARRRPAHSAARRSSRSVITRAPRSDRRSTFRDFHDQVLHDGQLPLAVLEQKITAWTQRARNSNYRRKAPGFRRVSGTRATQSGRDSARSPDEGIVMNRTRAALAAVGVAALMLSRSLIAHRKQNARRTTFVVTGSSIPAERSHDAAPPAAPPPPPSVMQAYRAAPKMAGGAFGNIVQIAPGAWPATSTARNIPTPNPTR